MATHLKERQVELLENILSSTSSDGVENDFADQWKILVYDRHCRDIISPLMNVAALRAKGITLHLLIDAEREPVADAPAVYLIQPTEDNIRRIVEDCKRQLYRGINIHFISRIDRPLLESLAQQLVTANATSMIRRVYDEYLDVISLESTLFTLNMNNSFIAYNDPSHSEEHIKQYMSSLSMGLLSLTRILGAIPVIRAAAGGPAEMLAAEYTSAMREHLMPRGPAHAIYSEYLISDRPRPLLLIYDRTGDMVTPLLHTSTYHSLIDDVLDYKLNKISIDKTKKSYDMNSSSDAFFSKYASATFPEAIESNEVELKEITAAEAALRSRTQQVELSSAIESLPEILLKKQQIEVHTNILQQIMTQIISREIPTFYELEQYVLMSNHDKQAVITALKESNKGNALDKIRLLCILVLSDVKSNEFEAALNEYFSAAPTAPSPILPQDIPTLLSFLRRMKSLQSPMSFRAAPNATLTSLLTSAHSQASSLLNKATSFFTKYIPVSLSRIVENLLEGKSCPEDDSYCCFDPKAKPSELVDLRGRKYSEVVVFVIGGGCYYEYYNILEMLKQKQNTKKVYYGGSEMMNSATFLNQLAQLSKLSGMGSAPSSQKAT